MARLPTPGGDDGTWGSILNDFLNQEHNSDGTQKTLPITKGGTGATNASTALTNLAAVGKGDLVFNVKDYGAKGDGSTDDTSAIGSARDTAGTGGTVLFPPGTYSVTGLFMTKANQTWILSPGATLKSRAVNAAGAVIIPSAPGLTITGGGIVDGNLANVTSNVYGFYSASSSVTDLIMSGITIQNTKGSAFSVAASRTRFVRNRVTNCNVNAIAFNPCIQIAPSDSDIYSCEIADNTVDLSMLDPAVVASAALFIGGSPRSVGVRSYVHNALECRVSGNDVRMPASPSALHADAAMCIAFGAQRSLCIGNTVSGGSMGISADVADDSVVSGNTVFGPNWYAIEVPDTHGLVVSGNVVDGNAVTGSGGGGGLAAIELTGSYGNADILITGNRVSNYTSNGIAINNGSQHVVSGNIVDSSGIGGGGIASTAVDSTISGNTILGPGFATSKGIILANIVGRQVISGNMIGGFTWGINLQPTSVVQDGIAVTGNEFHGCTVNLHDGHSGSGSFGSSIVVSGNSGLTDYANWASNVQRAVGTGSPEGVVTAGIGSVYQRLDGGAGTSYYVKESGTGSTGWVAK